jgi:hypothetical protein
LPRDDHLWKLVERHGYLRFFLIFAMYAFAAALPFTSRAGFFDFRFFEVEAERLAPLARAAFERFFLRLPLPDVRVAPIAPLSIDWTAGVC